jgi:hypothetical protein
LAQQLTLYTKVQRTGSCGTFAFLGPHGITIEEDGIAYLPGNIVTLCAMEPRKFAALETALGDYKLSILSTPPPILFDVTDNIVKQLALDNGVLGTEDVSWADSD